MGFKVGFGPVSTIPVREAIIREWPFTGRLLD
jgi:hypothetical protein